MVGRLQRAVDIQLPKTNLIDIQFEDINFSIKQGRKERKAILKNISGKFKAGELTAIMGPSGAGKSSLLNILTGFQKDGVQGRISSSWCDSRAAPPRIGCDAYKKDSCYILQDDRLNPLFTVQEIMRMAAELKLGYSINMKAKEYLLNEILNTMGLANSTETRCDKLSGGQKKRLSIALELIDNPPIMFLDEPTTGLDSLASLHCVSTLKSLALGGRTIVCTIHQPSASIYELFDHVYVIASGNCVYQGDRASTVPYLRKINLPCPEYHNPADHLIEVASGDFGDYTDRLIKVGQELCWRSNNSRETDKLVQNSKDAIVAAGERDSDGANGAMVKAVVLVNPPSEFYRFRILLCKCYLQMYRDWTVTHLKFILHILIAIFIGFLFFNFGDNGYESVSNVSYMLVSLVYLCYTSMMPAVLKFPSEIRVLKKERFNNWYQLRTYYAAHLVSSIPIQVMFTFSYGIISYILSGQIMQLDRCCQFIVVLVFCTLIAEGIGVFFGTITNPVNGTFLSCILLALFLALAGVIMPFSQMSPIWYAFSYISYMAYGIDALVQAMYGHDRPNLSCPAQYEYCHYTQPATLLKDLGIESGGGYWNDVAVLVGMFVIMKFVGFCTLKMKLSGTT